MHKQKVVSVILKMTSKLLSIMMQKRMSGTGMVTKAKKKNRKKVLRTKKRK